MPRFEENDYIIGFWVGEDVEHNNFLMSLWEHDGQLKCEYRFRDVKDTRIWNSRDEKRFYAFDIPPEESREGALEKLHKIFKVVQTKYPGGPGYIPVEGGTDKLFQVLSADSLKHYFQSLSIRKD